MEQEDKHFNVLLWDFNNDKLEHYDVLPYLRKQCLNEKAPDNYENFKTLVENESRYQFWARCEYEMICHGWPVRRNDYKLDVHEQIMMNIDIIASILWDELQIQKGE